MSKKKPPKDKKLVLLHITPTPKIAEICKNVAEGLNKTPPGDTEVLEILAALLMTTLEVMQRVGLTNAFSTDLAQMSFSDVCSHIFREAGCTQDVLDDSEKNPH